MAACSTCGCLLKHRCEVLSRLPTSKWVEGHTGRIEKIRKKLSKPLETKDLQVKSTTTRKSRRQKN